MGNPFRRLARNNRVYRPVDDVFFEEIIADRARRFDAMELPLSSGAFAIARGVALLVSVCMAGRLLYLNMARNDAYTRRAFANSNRATEVAAPRGIIYDRFGVPLVEDVPDFALQIRVSELRAHPDAVQAVAGIIPRALSTEEIWSRADAERSDIVTIARGLTLAEVARARELRSDALVIENTYRRRYPYGESLAHILGYTGAVSPSDLSERPDLSRNDVVGKDGLELAYDDVLRGARGESVTYRDARGDAVERKVIAESASGEALVTTIDAEFQQFLYDRMKRQTTMLGSPGGAAIAVDPRTGEIISLVSLPAFDNNIFTDENRAEERARILISPSHPLFNRAISGTYSPGSTIKPLMGVAALAEHVVDTATRFFSAGYIDVPNPYDPDNPSRFLDWRPNGWVDIASALAKSSNIFFYYAGGGYGDFSGLGIQRINAYWKKFLLGDKTGVDLPGEARSLLPEPYEQEQRTGRPWLVGDTYNISIGQGDLLITPLQLIDTIAAIANKGVLYRPHVAKNGQPPAPLADLSVFRAEMAVVEQGMRDAVTEAYGTAHLLSDLPVAIAAKTGSAQILNNTKTNAFFVGYTPDAGPETPQLALLVLIEDARTGSSNAIPVARDAFAWYYEHRIKSSGQ
ncbi:MAG: hypothetical protein HYS43_01170 [Candidatus Liptonbacteria bacterium]|nr:hypothetical protein [Candidatus Liptonbacteria bacterium]